MQNQYDVIIVGAGPAGLMSAISAGSLGAKVLLLEKNKKVGRKLRMTGGGRCNVTNNQPLEELISQIPGNGRFLYSTFAQFDNQDIMAFFAEQNIALKEEDHGRMFPVTDRSKTIVEALLQAALAKGVTLKTSVTVTQLIKEGDKLIGVATTEGDFYGKSLVITTGGMTYSGTGSSGDGYKFAKSCGHHITPLFATEAPLVSDDDFIKAGSLQGLSLQEVALSVMGPNNKPIITQKRDLLFTHFGLSGPAALRCAYFVNLQLRKFPQEKVTLQLDCLPEVAVDKLKQQLQEALDTKKQVKNALAHFLPERLLLVILAKEKLTERPAQSLTTAEIAQLADLIKAFPIQINRTIGLEKAFVTAGGVELKEINPKTLASKLTPGLYFAGEVLDINGYTGGFNITAALATGYVSGQSAAYRAFEED